MSDVTRILADMDGGDPSTAEKLLPLVYDELRKLAAARLAEEQPGQTLQATALVHEAFLRLVEGEHPQGWDGRGHFFAAAAEAMRRILVDNARRKQAAVHGGGWSRIELSAGDWLSQAAPEEVIALDDSLAKLEEEDTIAARLTVLRVFAGMSIEEAAESLKMSRATAYRHWTYARAFLRHERLG